MKSVRFLDVWLNADTDEFHVDSTVTALDKDDTKAVLGGYTDSFLEECSKKSPEQVRAIQTMLLSFAAGIAAGSGSPQQNVDYFASLVSRRVEIYKNSK